MALRIEKTFQVKEPLDKVWSFLSDPRKVAVCVPGAQITEQVAEKNYKGAISVKVGPSVTDYKGEVTIVRLDPQNHEIEILGKGQDVRGRGSASMKMTGKLRARCHGGGTEGQKHFGGERGRHPGADGRRASSTEVSNMMFAGVHASNFQDAACSRSSRPLQRPPQGAAASADPRQLARVPGRSADFHFAA